MKKQSNHGPPDNPRPAPPPPPPPPNRTFKDTFFRGFVETKESKLRFRDYQNFMKGWREAKANNTK